MLSISMRKDRIHFGLFDFDLIWIISSGVTLLKVKPFNRSLLCSLGTN